MGKSRRQMMATMKSIVHKHGAALAAMAKTEQEKRRSARMIDAKLGTFVSRNFKSADKEMGVSGDEQRGDELLPSSSSTDGIAEESAVPSQRKPLREELGYESEASLGGERDLGRRNEEAP